MSRRSSAIRRDLLPDPRYDSVEVSKFINNLMIDGKKSLSERIFYEALDICQEKSGQPGLTVFTQALNTSKPSLEVKSRRVGGATYQVPVEVRPSRRNALAMRWLVDAARKRNEKSMTDRLAGELMDAADKRGGAARKKDEVHRMAEANKAFSHFRF